MSPRDLDLAAYLQAIADAEGTDALATAAADLGVVPVLSPAGEVVDVVPPCGEVVQ